MKRIYMIPLLALSLIFPLAACSLKDGGSSSPPSSGSSSSGEAYHKITAEEAKKMIEEGGVTIVDVRTTAEYAERHIPGAVLAPVETIGLEPPQTLPEKDAVLLVYCRSGVRSRQASDKLVMLGYTNVYDFGGIVDWPYETESGKAK